MDLEVEEEATGAAGDAHLKSQARQRFGAQDQQQGLMTAADIMPLWASAQEASSSMAVTGGGGGGGTEDTGGEGRKWHMEFGGGLRGEGDEYGGFEVVKEGEYEEEDEGNSRQTRALTADRRQQGRPESHSRKKEKKREWLKQKQRKVKISKKERREEVEGRDRMLEMLRLVVARPESREEVAGVAGGSALQAVIMDSERSHALKQAYREVVQGITDNYMFRPDQLPSVRLEVVATLKEYAVVMLELRGEWVGIFTVKIGLSKYGQLIIPTFYVRPECQGLGVERAALHLINTLALAVKAAGICFSQAIDARTRPELVKMWEDWGVTVAEVPRERGWKKKGQAQIRRMSITPEAASEMHARYTEEQLRIIDEHLGQQQQQARAGGEGEGDG